MYENKNIFNQAQSNLKKAKKIAEYLKMSEDTLKAIDQRLEVNLEASRKDRSYDYIQKELRKNPENEGYNFKLGEYYFSLGEFEKRNTSD